MSPGARLALFAVAASLLGVAAVYFGLRGGEEEAPHAAGTPRNAGVGRDALPGAGRAAAERVVEAIRRERRADEAVIAGRENPAAHRHEGPRPGDLAALAAEGERAKPVARRFFTAFSRYELGALGDRVEAELRATATSEFARELIESPPRVSPASEPPTRPARLGALEFVPGEAAGGRLVSAELVGEVKRAGRRSPIAIELRAEGGAWRVAGLGG